MIPRQSIQGLVAALLCVGLPNLVFAETKYQIATYSELLGWETDKHVEPLEAFVDFCVDISASEWKPLCAYAAIEPDAKPFFESFVTPAIVQPDRNAVFTGYYEPVLEGSLARRGKFQYPIYKKPLGVSPRDPDPTRTKIDEGALNGRGLEIAFLDKPIEAYFLHIQGFWQINLTNGKSTRVGYSGENGHVYRSAPRELVRQGEVSYSQASIQGLKAWAKKNPDRVRQVLKLNASYVCFRKIDILEPEKGPLGALERPMTALRSTAREPKYAQTGALVWIQKGGQHAIRRLIIALDVGAAIKGPQRADIFFGTGDKAGKLSGKTKDGGRMVVLLPIQIANRLAPNG